MNTLKTEIATPADIDEYTTLPVGTIHKRPGSDRFFVKDAPIDATHGDGIFDSIDDAKSSIEVEKKWRQWGEDNAAKELAVEEQERAYVASFGGFLSDNPLQFGRARKVLSLRIRYHGKATTRKELIEDKLSQGWFAEDDRITDGDVWVAITKTGAKYADFLLEKESE